MSQARGDAHDDERAGSARGGSLSRGWARRCAYHFGAWLNDEGVEIDERQYTGIRCRIDDYTTEARVIVSMAGMLAEHKYHGGGDRRRFFVNEETISCLEEVRNEWVDDGDDEWGDHFVIARAMLDEDPEITDKEYAKALRRHERQAWLILNEPDVWRAVENLATALLKSGRLTNAEALAVTGWGWRDAAKANTPPAKVP